MKHLWLCAALAASLCLSAPALAGDTSSKPNPLAGEPVEETPGANKPGWMQYENPYIGEQNNLSNPHRTPEEIQNWTQIHATDALNFTGSDTIAVMKADGVEELPEEPNAKLLRLKKDLFTEEGWLAYASWMRDSGSIDRVRLKGQSMSTIVNGVAVTTEKNAYQDAYRWTVRLPVMISFVEHNFAEEDMERRQKTLRTEKYNVLVRMKRIPLETPESDGLMIDGWKVESPTAPPPTTPQDGYVPPPGFTTDQAPVAPGPSDFGD